MYPKFIITDNGTLRFGHVYLHKELLLHNEQCTHGGGLWKIDHAQNAILLYGKSFDFGYPAINQIKKIDWNNITDLNPDIYFLPKWPDETIKEKIYIQ